MKHANMPLIQALKGRSKLKPTETLEGPRIFEVKHDEVTGLPGRKVGDQISVHLTGRIHSQHADGHALIHVDHVKPDTSAMDHKEDPVNGPSRTLNVRTQESHSA